TPGKLTGAGGRERRMRQSTRTKGREAPKTGRQPSGAEMQERIAALEAELVEARAEQTATAEVLGVINSSPGDLAPVFDAMLEKALRLCDAAFGLMRTWGDGEYSPPVAVRGAPAELAEVWRTPIAPTPNSAAERIAQGETCVVVPNLLEDPMYLGGAPGLRALVELGGARSYAVVALRKEDVLLGIIAIYRQEVRPFTDKQI